MTAAAYILGPVVLVLLYFAFRGYWLVRQADRHAALVTYYCHTTKQGAVMADELIRIWPGVLVLLDYPWHWDWARYVIRSDLYMGMMEWFVAQDAATRPETQ